MSNDCKGLFDAINKTVPLETKDAIVSAIEDTFKNNVSYYQVYKNYDFDRVYDALIIDYSDWREVVSRKKIIMYPEQELADGDYVHWTYGGADTVWLVMSSDQQHSYRISGEIQRTNNDLKWYNNDGDLISWRCVIENKVNESAFNFARYLATASGDLTIYVQKNSDTELIEIDDRFIFNGQAFRMRALNNFANDGVLTLSVSKDSIAEDDDLTNNIADTNKFVHAVSINQNNFEGAIGYTGQLTATVTINGVVQSKTLEWISSDPALLTIDSGGNYTMLSDGSVTVTCRLLDNNTAYDTIDIEVSAAPVVEDQNIISPAVTEILQGDTQLYSVYKYESNLVQADTFTITTSGVPIANYTLSITDGNNFSIKNLERYDESVLTVLCTNNVDATSVSIDIHLEGLW